MNPHGSFGNKLLLANGTRMSSFSDVGFDMSIKILFPHELLTAHFTCWHLPLQG